MATLKTVFLSSTGSDLRRHREAVYQAIEGLEGYHCVRMENFGARDWEADAFCRAKVAECDLFVGIVGHVHGSCPEGSEQSYTEREYDAAVAADRPRLMFIAPRTSRSRPISSSRTSAWLLSLSDPVPRGVPADSSGRRATR